MKPRPETRRVGLLIIILAATGVICSITTISFLYQTALAQQRQRLHDLADSEARLVEAVGQRDLAARSNTPNADDTVAAQAATLRVIESAQSRFTGLGRTGELIFARREGDSIVYVTLRRHAEQAAWGRVIFGSPTVAVPMTRALSGISGVIVAPDYRRVKVLAATEPVRVFNLGVVAKIDLSEVQAPFVRAGLLAMLVALIAVGFGSFLFVRVADPLIRRIRESEERQRLALDIGQIGNFVLDPVAGTLRCDERVQILLGVAAIQPLAQALDTVHSDDRALIERELTQALDPAKRVESAVEVRVRDADGNTRWLAVRGRAAFNEKASPPQALRVTGVLQDITARKQAEAALQAAHDELEVKVRERTDELARSVERFRQTLDSMMEGCMIIGFDWRYLYINDVAAQTALQKRENLIGRTMLEMYPGVEQSEVFARYRRTMEERVNQRFEESYTFADGTSKSYSFSVVPVPEGIFVLTLETTEQKQAEMAVQQARDILEVRVAERTAELDTANAKLRTELDERKRVEDALRQSRAALQGILDATGESVWLFSPEGVVLLGNDVAVARMGRPAGEIIGKPLAEILLPELARSRGAHLREVVESGRPVEFEDERAGMQFRHNFYPVIDAAGRVTAVASFSADITERKRAEEEIRHQAQLLGQVSDAIFATDNDTRITYWNRGAEQLYGFTAAEALGRIARDMLHIDSAPGQREVIFSELARSGAALTRMHTKRRDGNDVVVEISSARLADPAGKPGGYVVVHHDVTERERAEQALRQSEERFRALIEQSPVAITYARAGRTLYANPVYLKMFGFSHPNELIGHPLTEQIAPQCREEVAERVRLRAQGGSAPLAYEAVGLRKDGTEFPFAVEVTQVALADGPATIAFFNDITERKQAEAALRETRDYLENLIDYANAPIIVWNPLFRITQFNHAFERLTGRPAKDVLGKELDILFPADRRRESLDLIRRTLTGERWETVEIPIQHVNGGVRTVLWNSATLFEPDGRTAVATIAQGQDITERKQAEQALAKNDAEYREFTQLLAHSIKSPLSTIRLTAQRLDAEREAMARDVLIEQVERLNRIALGLMYLSESRTHQRGHVDLNPLVVRALDEQATRHKPGLKVQLDLAPGLPPVHVNEEQIVRILCNLVENAVAAMDGKGVLTVSTALAEKDSELFIEVSDTGPGIPAAYRDRLFQPFFTRKPGGTGLGLSIVKRIVEDHGGRIEFSSEPGSGATFRVFLPAEATKQG